MIFAALDYLNYRQRRGRYSDAQPDAGMGALAFVDEIPDSQIRAFRIGDMIFTQRLNSFMSWAMMYVTSSPVDHTAIYYGDGKVAHRTLTGAGLHSLRSLAKNCRVVIIRMNEGELRHWSHEFEALRPRIHKGSKIMHALPTKGQLAVGALLAIHGLFPDRFRWKLWLDFFFAVGLLSVLYNQLFGSLLIFGLPLYSLFSLLVFRISGAIRRLRNQPSLIMSHPDIGYRLVFKVGGLGLHPVRLTLA
jgi:hypothetical protein